MEITGLVHEILPTVQVNETFKKRDIIICTTENDKYPEYIKLEAHNDKCDKLNGLRVGDTITVHFNLRGRPWTDKNGNTSYFNTLALWKFDIGQTVAEPRNYTPPVDINSAPQEDDLPF